MEALVIYPSTDVEALTINCLLRQNILLKQLQPEVGLGSVVSDETINSYKWIVPCQPIYGTGQEIINLNLTHL